MEMQEAEIPIYTILTLILATVLSIYATRKFGAFSAMGIKGPRPLPFLGNYHQIKSKGVLETDVECMNRYGKTYVYFHRSSPWLIIGDVSMLREIQVKEFASFCNRRIQLAWQESPLEKMLVAMTDNDWKHVRNTVSHIFNGSKLKRIEGALNETCKQMSNTISRRVGRPMDARQLFSDFSMDSVARCVFGQDMDCARNPDHPFLYHAKTALSVHAARPLRGLAAVTPSLARVLKRVFRMRYMPRETLNYFTGILDDAKITADDPKEQDLLKMMINAHRLDDEWDEEDKRRKSESSDLDRVPLSQALDADEVLAQGLCFLHSAYHTIMDSLTCTLFLLAKHPEIQEKVVDEMTIITRNGAKVNIESLNELTYLQCVLDESLRLYSPTLRLERVCGKDVVINGLHIPKKTTIVIPIQAIHLDPSLWPDPLKFDPQRFSPEQKAMRDPYSWQPFGMGPRSCVGVRLAIFQMKMALVSILRKYRVTTLADQVARNKATGSPEDLFVTFHERD